MSCHADDIIGMKAKYTPRAIKSSRFLRRPRNIYLKTMSLTNHHICMIVLFGLIASFQQSPINIGATIVSGQFTMANPASILTNINNNNSSAVILNKLIDVSGGSSSSSGVGSGADTIIINAKDSEVLPGGQASDMSMKNAYSHLADLNEPPQSQQPSGDSAILVDNLQSVDSVPLNLNKLNNNNNKQSRQLIQTNYQIDEQLSNAFNERHLQFSIDLLQSLFMSQSFNVKTKLIESFLVSPVSVQMVLMMMHLGARGQTKQEIAECLHLPLTLNQLPAHQQQQTQSKPIINNNSNINNNSGNKSNQQQQSKLQKRNQQYDNSFLTNTNVTTSINNQIVSVHELFGMSIRNLLKDPSINKALTSANQVFIQKNLVLAPNYEWSIRHYYSTIVKPVDFQRQTTSSSSPSAPQATIVMKDDMQQQQQQKNQQQQETTPAKSNNIQTMINDWVEKQTRGKISNFLNSPVSTSTLLMAINVLYFRSDWQYKFDPTDTEPDAWFTLTNGKTVKVPMMVNKLPVAFAHDNQMRASVIELPYKAQRLGLFLILPDEHSGIYHTMRMLNATTFTNLITSMRKTTSDASGGQGGINVRIPKFNLESTPRLTQILSQQMGLKTLFSSDMADLSGMFASSSPPPPPPPPSPSTPTTSVSNTASYIGQKVATSQQQLMDGKEAMKLSLNLTPPKTNESVYVPQLQQQPDSSANPDNLAGQIGLDELIHKAILQIDEQGSVAAASSATVVERVGVFNSHYFEADHPFLLFLMDKQTGLVLFSGVYAGQSNDQ